MTDNMLMAAGIWNITYPFLGGSSSTKSRFYGVTWLQR